MSLTKAGQAAVDMLKSGGSVRNLVDTAYDKGGIETVDPTADPATRGKEAPGFDDDTVVNSGEDETLDASDLDEDLDPDEELEDEEDTSDTESEDDDTEEEEDEEPGEEEDRSTQEKSEPDVEEFEAAGRKIRIDYSNREATKRAYVMAAGMRKFQAERDAAQSEVKELKTGIEQRDAELNDYRTLDTKYTEGGIDAVIQHLEGKSLDQLLDDRQAEHDRVAAMSPQERAEYEREQIEAKYEAKLKAAEERLKSREAEESKAKEADEAKQKADQEAAELAKIQGWMDSAGAKYEFHGKLKDPTRENQLDEMLFNQVKATIAGLPDDVEITEKLIADEFRRVHSLLDATINREANKRADKSVKRERRQAKKNIQAEAVRANRRSRKPSKRERAVAQVRRGDITGLVQAVLRGK